MKLNEIEYQLLKDKLSKYTYKYSRDIHIALQEALSTEITNYVELATPSVFPTNPPDSIITVRYQDYFHFFEMKRLPSHADNCIPKGVQIELPKSEDLDLAIEAYLESVEYVRPLKEIGIIVKEGNTKTIEQLIDLGYPRHLIPEDLLKSKAIIWQTISNLWKQL